MARTNFIHHRYLPKVVGGGVLLGYYKFTNNFVIKKIKNKHIILAVVVLVLVFVVGFLLFTMNKISVDNNLAATGASTLTLPSYTCNDTDGGVAPYVKGTVVITYLYRDYNVLGWVGFRNYYYTDACTSGCNNISEKSCTKSICTGSSCNPSSMLKQTRISCPNGGNDGSCYI